MSDTTMTPEVAATSDMEVATPKKKKGVYRLLAIVALAICAALVFLPINFFTGAWAISAEENLLTTLQDVLASKEEKLFDFLPVLIGNVADEQSSTAMLANLLIYVLVLGLAVAAIFAVIALLSGKKGLTLTAFIALTLSTLVYGVGVYLISKKMLNELALTSAVLDIKVLAVAAASLLLTLLLIFCRPRKAKAKKAKNEKAEKVDPVKEALADFRTEEYVEAYAYDGGPVAGVELAEEVYPTLAKIDAVKDPDGAARNTVASLLGNGFDPFLITLSDREKSEFIDIYVLKCKGIMPEIPGYVVGGNNKDFFNKVFIYLGQYRDKIPATLLSKMYEFSMKI